MKAFARDFVAGMLQFLHLSEPARRFADHFFVVTFHRVLPEFQRRQYPMPGLVVTPEELEWFVCYFRQWFQCQRLDMAWNEHRSGYFSELPRLAITFDDGQLDNYLHAAPVLDRLGVPATFFIPVEAVESQQLLWHDRMGYAIQRLLSKYPQSELLAQLGLNADSAINRPHIGVALAKQWDQDERLAWIRQTEALVPDAAPEWDGMMRWDQIRELSQRGHEIGSHSYTHPILTQCDNNQLAHEILTSRIHIEREVNCEVKSFCYPNGDHDIRVVDAVKEAGYSLAVTTLWGSNAPGSDAFALHRHDMVAANSLDRHGRLSPARVSMRMVGFAKGTR